MATGLAPTSTDIAARVSQIVSTDSPLMRKATATGLAQANRRGLINSTMGIGAVQDSMLGVATPIASQEAAQASQEGIAARDLTSREKLSSDQILSNEGIAARDLASKESMNTANLAAAERERILSGQVQLSGNYQQAIVNALQNENIPAAERNSIMSAIRANYESALASLRNLYGI